LGVVLFFFCFGGFGSFFFWFCCSFFFLCLLLIEGHLLLLALRARLGDRGVDPGRVGGLGVGVLGLARLGGVVEDTRPVALRAVLVTEVGVARGEVHEVALALQHDGAELVRRSGLCGRRGRRGGLGRGSGRGLGGGRRGLALRRRGLRRRRGVLLRGLLGGAARLHLRDLGLALLVRETLPGALAGLLRGLGRGLVLELGVARDDRGRRRGLLLLRLGLGGSPGRAARQDVGVRQRGEVLLLLLRLLLQSGAELEVTDSEVLARVALRLEESTDALGEEAPGRGGAGLCIGVALLLLLLGALALRRGLLRGGRGGELGGQEALEGRHLALQREDLGLGGLELGEDQRDGHLACCLESSGVVPFPRPSFSFNFTWKLNKIRASRTL
jgi:hypothetical protein